MSKTLYNINQQIIDLVDQAALAYEADTESDTPNISFDFDGKMNQLQMEFNEKIDQISKYRQEIFGEQLKIKNEIDRLTKLKKSNESKITKLENYITFILHSQGIEKLNTGLFKISFRPSQSVVIDDESKIAEEYKKIETITKVDKDLIKKHIKLGVSIDGVHIEEHKNLQIK